MSYLRDRRAEARRSRNSGGCVLTDFPDSGGDNESLEFREPREIIVAESLPEVRDALAAVEQRAVAGQFAVGFVAYDAAQAFDSALRVASRAATPLVWFGIYDAPSPSPSPPSSRHGVSPAGGSVRLKWRANSGREEYSSAIEDIRRRIGEGGFYQVNHTIRLRAEGAGGGDDTVAMYHALRAAQPSSYGMYVDTGRFHVLSVSPELFFERRGARLTMRPMKGTARRGRWSAEDTAAGAALASSVKDRAENVMIVDLVRNDLGRISETGSVQVTGLFDVERHPTVWQMTSTVTAAVRGCVKLCDIFAALFPCGSVVGAPKIAAASWIADNEIDPRGVYCGAMGIVRPGGDCVFNVAIRTVVIDGETGVAEYGTGGAITIDSTPAGEYDELRAKTGVLTANSAEFELVETLRLSNGKYLRRDRHVRRVLESAAYFGFRDSARSVQLAMDACTDSTPSDGDYRVRLLVARNGSARTEVTPMTSPDGAPLAPLAPLACVIATSPVLSRDPFLFHKTTLRATYDERRAAHPEAGEIILINERGELTECSIGNLVAELAGRRFTPPLDSGLLPGVFRDELLERGTIAERVLRPADLVAATGLWRVNSLREWTELVLV